MGKTYSSSNLIVGVTYYTNRSNSVKQCCNDYNDLLNSYINYLNDLNAKGIVSGKTADTLKTFISEVEKAKDIIKEIGKSYSENIINFLEDIDDADDLLFKNKGRKILTDAEFNNARAYTRLELTLKSFFDGSWINDRIWGGVAKELSDKDSKLAKKVQELNNLTKSDLSKIQGNVKAVDKKYSNIFRNIYKELTYYEVIIKKIAYIVSPDNFNFIGKNIAELKNTIEIYDKFYEKLKKDPEYSKISDSDVKMFSENVDGYFDKSVNGIRGICEDSLANLFLTDFEKYRATVNAAKAFFNSYSKDYTISKEKFDAAKNQFDDMLSLYKQYGSDWINHTNNPNAELFNKIISKFDDVSKNSDKYIDIWYQLFFDMSESKEVLNRFKNNCDINNENVKKAIERIEDLYNKEIDAFLSETVEEFEKSAIENGRKAAADAIVKSLKSKNKIIGKLCDEIFNNAFSEMPAVAEYEWVESTNVTLNNAIEKLRNTSPDSENYKENVKAVREAFKAAKDAQLNFYKKMSSVTKDETEKNYYDYCYETIENASMNDFGNLDIMYLSQYNGSNYNPLTDLTY